MSLFRRMAVVCGALTIVWGCAESPVEPSTPTAPTLLASAGGQERHDVCHVDGQGRVVRITVADPALDTHLGHGDRPANVMPAGASFSASRTWTWWQYYLTYEPVAALAFDGDANTMWNAGDWPTNWVEVDFGSPQQFLAVTALVAQSPNGYTTVHEVTLDGAPSFTWSGTTSDRDLLSYTFGSVQVARRIRITTTSSPSWVGWWEIKIFGC